MAGFGDDTGDILDWAPWATIGVKFLWLLFLIGPLALYLGMRGHPITVLEALKRVDLAHVSEAKDPITGEPAKTQDFSLLSISIAVVVSKDAIWAYDLGPDVSVGEFEYPGEMFYLPIEAGELRAEDLRGQYIAAFGQHLDERRNNLIGLLGEDAELRVQFAVDTAVPFSTLRALMYTAGQERHLDFFHLLQGDDKLRVQESMMPTIGPPDPCAHAAVSGQNASLFNLPGMKVEMD